MKSPPYAFTQGLDFPSIVTASERVAWTVDDVFQDRRFDASKPIVPTSWVGLDAVGFLNDRERRILNHCRAFSYVHLFGNLEEFIPLHLAGFVQQDWHDGRERLRTLFRFGEEEMKHQQLFRRAEKVLEQSCGHAFGRYFDEEKEKVMELTKAILTFPPLPRFLILLALELGSQRHYVESFHERQEQRGDPLYVDILKAHWAEEAQHTKAGMLEIAQLAEALGPDALSAAFTQIMGIAELINTVLLGQVAKEVETFQQVTRRTLTNAEATALREALFQSMNLTLCGVALSHPDFMKVCCQLSKEGAAKLGFA
jgi:hypothetical protein